VVCRSDNQYKGYCLARATITGSSKPGMYAHAKNLAAPSVDAITGAHNCGDEPTDQCAGDCGPTAVYPYKRSCHPPVGQSGSYDLGYACKGCPCGSKGEHSCNLHPPAPAPAPDAKPTFGLTFTSDRFEHENPSAGARVTATRPVCRLTWLCCWMWRPLPPTT